MKKCYYSKKYVMLHRFLYGLVFVCSGTLITLGIWLYSEAPVESCITIFIGLAFILYGVLSIVCFDRDYELTEEGIIVQYAKRKKVFYSWECINQICICKIFCSGNHAFETPVIWCTAGNIKHAPPDPKRRWDDSEYLFFHFRSILTMEYTPERLAEFQKYARIEIQDFR